MQSQETDGETSVAIGCYRWRTTWTPTIYLVVYRSPCENQSVVSHAHIMLPTSITALTSLPSFKRQLQNIFIYQILPISLIFILVICVPCPRSYCSLCHVNLYVLLLRHHHHHHHQLLGLYAGGRRLPFTSQVAICSVYSLFTQCVQITIASFCCIIYPPLSSVEGSYNEPSSISPQLDFCSTLSRTHVLHLWSILPVHLPGPL